MIVNHYAIKRLIVVSETRFWDQKTQIASDPHLFIDRNVLNGKTYQYQVVSINESGDSEPATTAQVTPFSQVQPDGMIRVEGESGTSTASSTSGARNATAREASVGGYSGNGIYNTLGSQQFRELSVARNTAAVYFVLVQNDGKISDTINVTAPASGGGWIMHYFDIAQGTEVTAAVTGAGYPIRLAADATRELGVKVIPTSTVSLGATKDVLIKSVSAANAQKVDVVKAQTKAVQAEVQSVEWVSLEPQNPVSVNPNVGGGFRYFPDKLAPTDGSQKRIHVKASVPGVPDGTKVYFLGFDVDEPGTNSTPLDTNGSASGGDNREPIAYGTAPNTYVYKRAKSQSHIYEAPVRSGSATLELPVGLSAGDNYRVAASTNSISLTKLTVDSTATTGIFVPASDNSRIAGFPGAVSPTLYIWRRLHVEVDSMGAITGNVVRGLITRRAPAEVGSTTVTTDRTLDDSADRFENGFLKDSTGKVFGVTGSTVGTNFQVTVANTLGGAIPAVGNFELRDDDSRMATGQPSLQEGEDVPGPDTSLLATLFKPAYIEVLLDGGGNLANNQTDAPFRLNHSESGLAKDIDDQVKGSRNSHSSDEFWTTHCFAAFQPGQSIDGDPDRENRPGTPGVSSYNTAIVFIATGKDFPLANQPHLLVHEVAHNFGLPDEYPPFPTPVEKGIMFHAFTGEFTAQNLHSIRSYGHPSKELPYK